MADKYCVAARAEPELPHSLMHFVRGIRKTNRALGKGKQPKSDKLHSQFDVYALYRDFRLLDDLTGRAPDSCHRGAYIGWIDTHSTQIRPGDAQRPAIPGRLRKQSAMPV
ncbi:hypothetical protein C7374_101297 [Falsochrobactrum ovis]|uniref:Uncharacterized protein n=1 Tax=Falsochrobactrum ovis TaxID=1293442 RepID=A0A364JZ82_9HYPH|nr:hypothetical protein C7374_101297 [Falsochrobactrum ovis]